MKRTYFLIISLLVSSNAVVKETETFEKLFSFPVGRGYSCGLMLSMEMDLSFCNKICFS